MNRPSALIVCVVFVLLTWGAASYCQPSQSSSAWPPDSLADRPWIEVITTSNRTIEGVMLEDTGDYIRVLTKQMKSYQIPRSAVKSQKLSQPPAVVRQRPPAMTTAVAETAKTALPPAAPQNVISLKNGSVIIGIILKYEPLMVQVADSTVLTLSMDDVTSITKEEVSQRRGQWRPRETVVPPDQKSTPMPSRTSRWALFAGLGLPVGSLGETSGGNAGFASTGFAAGIDGVFGSDVVNASIGLLFAMNSADVSSQFNSITGAKGESGSWKSLWGTFGCRVYGTLAPSIRLYGEGVLGGLLGFSPELKLTISAYDPSTRRTITVTATQDPATAIAFAYGAGFGVSISQFSLAFRYLTGEPEYEFNATASGGGASATSKSKFKQPTSLIILTAGFSF